VAVAVVGQAGAIVTHNLGDFPPQRLPYGIAAMNPSEFAKNTVDLNPTVDLRAVEKMVLRSGLRGRKLSMDDVFADLVVKYDMWDAVNLMRRDL
jgi:hypothetical protein